MERDEIGESLEESMQDSELSFSDGHREYQSHGEQIRGISKRSSSEISEADNQVDTIRDWEGDSKFDDDADDKSNAHEFPFAAKDEELELLDKEYEELQAQELDMLNNLKGRSDEELLKGRSVRNQKAMWDKALEIRILLQKPFTNANRLPLGDTKTHTCESSEEIASAFERLNEASINTVHCLHQTLTTLLSQVDARSKVSDDDKDGKNNEEHIIVNDLDAQWEVMSASYKRFVPFRNSTVDRWQRKTQLSTGAAASRIKLRAFNQSITQQIEGHMRDFSRMLERMCLSKSAVNVIGRPAAENEKPSSDGDVNGVNPGEQLVDGDPELIDDSEFYQELLREFLESADPSSLGASYPSRSTRVKHRKIVDRRASKGRKIRYTVHEKIVNFMVPVPINMPPMAEKLFSSGLFHGGSTQPVLQM
ncbi:hypothetical protein KP509_11G058800 [Ceratopteris richardii]|nr:hypothetical protein KP509_11G058800 [Ceratopteris richardii]KAH7425524.1 hypothetical protein KP509_11G058800 [Ceratopteris richardii]